MLEFQVLEARPQASLETHLFHKWIFPNGKPWVHFYRTRVGYCLRFPELADFQISHDGCEICCWPVPGVSAATIQHLYLNQALPLALSKQGKLVLHASAVEIGSEGVAFIGVSGRGKSTLAASFAACGFRFLTDDGLLLEAGDGGFWILPSHPSIRLWQDSEAALIGENTQKASPVQYTAKSRFLASDDGIVFCEQARRLRRIYFLGEGLRQKPTFECMTPREALIELIKNSILLETEKSEWLAAHFDGLSKLASQPIFYRLDYPRHFEVLPQIRQAIIEHIAKQEDTA